MARSLLCLPATPVNINAVSNEYHILACSQYGWGLLASVVGEAHHLDHHIKPRREKRPGIDVPWYITLPLWRAAGLVGPASKVVPPVDG